MNGLAESLRGQSSAKKRTVLVMLHNGTDKPPHGGKNQQVSSFRLAVGWLAGWLVGCWLLAVDCWLVGCWLLADGWLAD